MGDAKKWLLAWIAKLLPKQTNTASGSVQVGQAGGNVNIVNLTQHLTLHHAPVHTGQPSAQAARPRAATPEQREVLALLARAPDRKAVLDFMRREFNNTMVIDLDGRQLFRLRRYVETVLTNGGRP